jgi:hypothetical protein
MKYWWAGKAPYGGIGVATSYRWTRAARSDPAGSERALLNRWHASRCYGLPWQPGLSGLGTALRGADATP